MVLLLLIFLDPLSVLPIFDILAKALFHLALLFSSKESKKIVSTVRGNGELLFYVTDDCVSTHLWIHITLQAYGCPNSRSSQIQSGSVSFSPEVQRKSWRNTAFFTHTSYLPGSDQIWLTELHYCGLFAVQGERAKGSLMGEGLWMNSSGRVWTEPREMRLTSLWLVLCWGATTTMCSREQMGPAMEGVGGGAQKQYATAGPAVKPDPPLWSRLVVWIARVSSSLSITSTPVFTRSDHRQYRTWHNPGPLHIYICLWHFSQLLLMSFCSMRNVASPNIDQPIASNEI